LLHAVVRRALLLLEPCRVLLRQNALLVQVPTVLGHAPLLLGDELLLTFQ